MFVMTKIVGRRRIEGVKAGALQRTLAAVRATGAVVPRGVYRFSSFEEAEAWMIHTMARTHANLKPPPHRAGVRGGDPEV